MAVESRYYELLDIAPGASTDEVRKAYRKQSLKWHPDKNPGRREEAEEKFKLLAEAYSVLSDAEMRERYDKYGEDGLKRGFQPPSASGAGYAPGHQGYGHSDQGGYAFRFKSANDIFSEFFGGRDPFASMFMESVFADPFADPFFSQHTGSAGLRAAAEHMPIERERRPYAGSGGGMTTTTTSQSVGAGFGFPSMFGGGGFPSMMFSSQFGSSNMPAAGSFSFVSSSTVGGEGGLRGAAGPSTRTSIQIINGAKIQTVEENDGRGNVTVTKISPDGSKEVSVNGVPQNTGAKRESPKKAVEGAGRQSYAQSRPSAQAHQPPPPQPAPAAAAANASVHASASRGGKKHESSDDESVVDIEVVELSDSSEEEALPPKRQVPLPRHEQRPTHHSTAETAKTPEHKAPSSSALEPSTKRRDADMRKDKPAAASTNEFYTATAATTHQPPAQHAPAASVPPLRPAHVTREPPAAQSSTRSSTYQPAAAAPRNEAEDMLTQARSRLKTAGGAAQSSAAPQPQHQQPISPSSHSSGGFKDILKATGASLLKSRPKMNRSSSASKAGPQPQSMQPAGGRAHGPIHRPGPLGALQPQVMSAAEHKKGAYGGQQHPYEPSISSGYASYNGAGGAVRSSGGPEMAASIPPLPPQQAHHAPPPPATGLSTPGHKQPRSKDRMRSTMHYNYLSEMGTGTRQPAGQHRSTMGASSVPPPLPQQPLDPRVPTPGYAQYQNYQYYQPPQQQQQQQEPVHYYGQALYVDPNSPQSAQSSYVSPPLTANAPDGVYQQQQSKYYSAQPLSATQARNQQQQHQQNVYGGSQHSGVSPGSATTATGPSNGYYQV